MPHNNDNNKKASIRNKKGMETIIKDVFKGADVVLDDIDKDRK